MTMTSSQVPTPARSQITAAAVDATNTRQAPVFVGWLALQMSNDSLDASVALTTRDLMAIGAALERGVRLDTASCVRILLDEAFFMRYTASVFLQKSARYDLIPHGTDLSNLPVMLRTVFSVESGYVEYAARALLLHSALCRLGAFVRGELGPNADKLRAAACVSCAALSKMADFSIFKMWDKPTGPRKQPSEWAIKVGAPMLMSTAPIEVK
jgi:hypothetical protein